MTRLGDTLAALKAARPTGDVFSPRNDRLVAVDDFGVNPGRLKMEVFAPTDRAPRAGLVVALHGCTQSAESYAGPSGWLDLAERHGFVVITPEQTRENNPNLCFNWFQPNDIQRLGGEAESIAQMTAHAITAFDIDPARVYVTGFSAGGAMTSVMLATWPELFAGGAVVAGLPYGVASSAQDAFQAMSGRQAMQPAELAERVRSASPFASSRPKVSIWHGAADTVVNPAAGEAVAAQWREVLDIAGSPKTARTPSGREFLVWMTRGGDPVLEVHRIPGLGHAVPITVKGPERAGAASMYSAETGVSSAHEIALGWGLATAVAISDTTREAAEDGGPSPVQHSHGSIAQVIDDALRSAGLVR